MERTERWRLKLMGHNVSSKRDIFDKFIKHREDIPTTILMTIRADLPRTFPNIPWVRENAKTIEKLLVSYAAVHKGDSYLQGFNYFMTILLYVFKDQEHATADTWWCFARIVGLIRPMMPDFNVEWFHWMRKHWIREFFTKLHNRPRLRAILSDEIETFSSIITVRWFMIWFAQTVVFSELFILWDFIIERPPHQLMRIYTLLTYEILEEVAQDIVYEFGQHPIRLIHSFLNIKIQNVSEAIERVKKCL